jgi:outer membrane protein
MKPEEILRPDLLIRINVDQLRLSVSNMQNRMQNMERQYEISKNLLKLQIGYDMDNDIELTDSLDELFNRMLVESGIPI